MPLDVSLIRISEYAVALSPLHQLDCRLVALTDTGASLGTIHRLDTSYA